MIDELSIIIPALNEEKYLPKLLKSIALQDFQGKMQVIVVDGNSQDHTIQVAERFNNELPELSILALRKRGIGYQRNRGAQKAKYKYLLFIDADIILPKNFLIRFLKKVNMQEQFIRSATIWVAERDIRSYLVFVVMYPLTLLIIVLSKITPGFLLLTTKENHIKINGFREDLKIAEDIDYGWRLIEAGAKYHVHYYPFVLFSTRRLRKIGRLNFFYHYFRGYIMLKKYGIEVVEKEKARDYPFGIF